MTNENSLLFFQVLELIGNPISQLPDEIFMQTNLVNLQEIVLSQCQVNVIERHAFKSLSNLMKLDLNHNQLSMVPSLAFHDITQLRELSLSFNPIEKVSLSLKWSHYPSFSAVFRIHVCIHGFRRNVLLFHRKIKYFMLRKIRPLLFLLPKGVVAVF